MTTALLTKGSPSPPLATPPTAQPAAVDVVVAVALGTPVRTVVEVTVGLVQVVFRPPLVPPPFMRNSYQKSL